MSKRICIVGGSITGCTTAIAAQRRGTAPTVFEKSNGRLEERGAGLGIPSAVAVALRDQGYIEDGFPHVSIRALVHSSVSQGDARDGGVAGSVPTFLEAIRWGHLFDHLRSLVPDEHYRAGVAVVDAQNEGNGVAVTLSDGSIERYDVAVFADGFRSRGRTIVCPENEPRYEGYFIWRGTLPETQIADSSRFGETLQRVGYPGGHFFAYLVPSPNGSTLVGERELNWGMFLPLSADALKDCLLDRRGEQHELSLPPGAMREEIETAFKRNAKSLLPDYFADVVARSVDTFGQGIVSTIPDTYRRGRICLAGDAGAVVPPFTTSGVYKGMKNGAELIAALADEGNLESALDAWDLEQQTAGYGLKRLSDVMAERLITNVPDFSAMTQDDLVEWWSVIQVTLQETLG